MANVAFCRATLHLPGIRNLKEKRSISQSVTSRVRSKFNVSVSEIGDVDLWQKLILGIVCVSSDGAYASGLLSSVVSYIESSRPDLELVDWETETLSGF